MSTSFGTWVGKKWIFHYGTTLQLCNKNQINYLEIQ